MRILIVSQYFWPERFRINEFVQMLSEEGHETTVLTGYPNYPNGFIYRDFKNNRKHYQNFFGAEIVRVPIIQRRTNYFYISLNYLSFLVSGIFLGSIKLKAKRFDAIVTFQTSPVTVAIVSGWFRFLKRCPHILWILDIWPETLVALGIIKKRWLIALSNYFVKAIYKRADCLLVQSKGGTKIVKRLAPKNVDVVYFPSWYDGVININDVRNSKKQRLKACREPFKIVFAGNIGKAQGFDCVLASMKMALRISNVCLHVYGYGSKAEWLKNEIEACGLGENISFFGEVSLEEIAGIFCDADALLLSLEDKPIFRHTVPAKVQSYLAAGKPIIGMIAGDAADILIESGAALLSTPGDAQSLAKNISKLSAMDGRKLQSMGESGALYARKHFSSDRMLAQFNEILNSVVE